MSIECGNCAYFVRTDPTQPDGWNALDGRCGWSTDYLMPPWADQAISEAYKKISSSDRPYCPCWREARGEE